MYVCSLLRMVGVGLNKYIALIRQARAAFEQQQQDGRGAGILRNSQASGTSRDNNTTDRLGVQTDAALLQQAYMPDNISGAGVMSGQILVVYVERSGGGVVWCADQCPQTNAINR